CCHSRPKRSPPRSKQPAGAFNEVTAWPSAHVSADCQSGHRSLERSPPTLLHFPSPARRGVPLDVGWCLVMPTSNSNRTYCYGLTDGLPSSSLLSWLAFSCSLAAFLRAVGPLPSFFGKSLRYLRRPPDGSAVRLCP